MKVKCINKGDSNFLEVGSEYLAILTEYDTYMIDMNGKLYYATDLFEVVQEEDILQTILTVSAETSTKPPEKLTISSFITSMPATSRTGVFQEANKFTVFTYDAEDYAETEERLQEIMESLLVLYKEGVV